MNDSMRAEGGATSDAVSTLRNSLASLIDESQALRKDIHGAEEARRRANQINLALLGLLILFVGLLVAIGWQGNEAIDQARETNAAIADCTTPGGKCYEDSRKRAAEFTQDIILVSIYMSQCARLYPGEFGPEYDRKLQACVYERLSRNGDLPPGGTATPSPQPSRST